MTKGDTVVSVETSQNESAEKTLQEQRNERRPLRILGVTTVDELVGKSNFAFFPWHLTAKYYTDEP